MEDKNIRSYIVSWLVACLFATSIQKLSYCRK